MTEIGVRWVIDYRDGRSELFDAHPDGHVIQALKDYAEVNGYILERWTH